MENEFVNPKAAIPSEEQDAPASVPAEADNQTAGNEGVGNEGQPEAAIPEGGPGDGADRGGAGGGLPPPAGGLQRRPGADLPPAGPPEAALLPLHRRPDRGVRRRGQGQKGAAKNKEKKGLHSADSRGTITAGVLRPFS